MERQEAQGRRKVAVRKERQGGAAVLVLGGECGALGRVKAEAQLENLPEQRAWQVVGTDGVQLLGWSRVSDVC